MRTIEWTGQFKRDYKREAKGQHRVTLDAELFFVINLLALDQALDQALEPRYRDHALTGEWKDHRDCHVKPDLVLIYQRFEADILRLVRLGSHAQLSL
jgi:mRNA interferase YafQ